MENKTSSGFGAFGGGGFGKSENGTGKSLNHDYMILGLDIRVIILGMIWIIISWIAGFKRLAGATSSSWGNSSSSSQEEVKEKKSKQEVKTGEEDEKNVLEVTTAKLFKVLFQLYFNLYLFLFIISK